MIETTVVDLYDQKINSFPIKDHEELEDILINAADILTEGDQQTILEALLNATVDFYVFCIEAGEDIEDIGFLVSEIEDRACNAVSFRAHLQEVDDDLASDNHNIEIDCDDDDSFDDEDDDLPTLIEDAPVCCSGCPSQCFRVSDPDDIREREIPGMMKRFESDGFEITVSLVPKREFDGE